MTQKQRIRRAEELGREARGLDEADERRREVYVEHMELRIAALKAGKGAANGFKRHQEVYWAYYRAANAKVAFSTSWLLEQEKKGRESE